MIHFQSLKELNLVATVFDVVGMEDGIQGRSPHNVIPNLHLHSRLLRLHQLRNVRWIRIFGSRILPRSNIGNSLRNEHESRRHDSELENSYTIHVLAL